jgi:hypothetical protein
MWQKKWKIRNIFTGLLVNEKGVGASKVKVKFSLEKATKAHRGSTGIATLFL